MTDILQELTRAIVIGLIMYVLIREQRSSDLHYVEGWKRIVMGFFLIFFGTLIDVTDNFSGLNRFQIVGDTPVQAFLEKVVDYLLGFMFLFIGIRKWLPKLIAHQQAIKENLQNVQKEMKVLEGLLPICAPYKNPR